MKEKYFSYRYLISIIILLTCLFLFSIPSLALIPGDFGSANNGLPDGVVDFEDLMIFALAYGSIPADTNWNPDCDIYPDGIIDFEDLMIFALHYGECECIPPSPPTLSDPGTNLTSPANYTVSWSAVTAATSYLLQEATSSDFTSGLLEYPLTDTSKDFFHTVTTTTTYYYRVAAVNDCGQSSWSSVENIIINCCAPPSAPILSDPGTTLPSPANYTVSWSAVTGAKSYVLQEDKSSSFSGAKEYTLGDTSKSFFHTVSTNTTYYYRVAAVDSCGQSDWSNVEDIIINCCTPPSAPILSDPGGTLPAPANYTVSWTPVSEATSYVLQEATSSSFSGATSHSVTGTSKSFSHTVITTYYYRVAAINDCGQGSWSNIVDIEICPCTPPSPPTLSDPGTWVVPGATYPVSWSAVSGATSYVLQEATSSDFSGATSHPVTGTSKDFSHTVSTTTYYYRVAAVDYCGPSGWSNVENITVVTGPVHNLTKDIYYKTIQEALYDADSSGGDTIEVPDGTYNESITFPTGKVVTLQSASGIRDNVIIRGVNNLSIVTINGSATGTTLSGFTITHTGGDTGSGISISSGNLIIDNCAISGNSTDYYGGGIYNEGTLNITSSTIFGNTANHGGGIYNKYGTLTITGSTISGNTANRGGGIYNSGYLAITSSTISGNTVAYGDDGGGIYNEGTLNITSSTISDNTAIHGGGGIYNYAGTLQITSSTISDNTANYGGGIYINRGTITITSSSTISGNSAIDGGGGIYNNDGTLTVSVSAISGNTANCGGGIYNSGYLDIISNIISGNTATTYGGGIYTNNGTITITSRSDISDNTADYGGGIYINRGTITITSLSTISGNSAIDDGGGIYIALISGTITIGGSSSGDIHNFNTFTDNKKDGTVSADQHIRNSSGDCRLSYPNNYYNPN